MKTKTIIFLIVAFIVGIILGAIIFGGKSQGKTKKKTTATESQQIDSVDYWTCAMHPQIHSDEPGNCPICGMELVPANSLTKAKPSKLEITLSEDQVAIARIQTSKVERAKPEKEILLQGIVKPDETAITDQAIHFDARIERIYVNYVGEYVRRGQKIATVYSPDLITAQQEFLDAVKFKDTNPLLYNAAYNKLKFWKLSDTQIKQIEQSKKVIDYFDILADRSGYVSKINVRAGDYVKEGNVLFEIVDLSRVWVVFDAYERDLPFIKVGDKIEFTVNALGNKKFTSRITFVSPLINNKTLTYDVRTEVANPNALLKPGMFANGVIKARLNVSKPVLIVPKSAVLWTGERSVVYVKVPNASQPTFQLRIVELGLDLGPYYEIKSGLQEGEEVVTYGAFTVDAAAELAGKYSMMNLPEDQVKKQTIPVVEYQSKTLTDKFRQMLDHYTKMTDYLVAASPDQVASEAKLLKQAAESIKMEDMPENAHGLWMEQLKIIKTQADNMVKMNNIDMQRKHYKELSAAMIKLAKSLQKVGGKYYIQFCPMYDENAGAFWISKEKQIRNPYYGDMMLTCGETKDSIM